ncbi:NAD(P)H dehydrogenase (quinone) [Gammaproteobacteria bacterium]|nr:NAD(P)H-binding protein [Gammaproteobacteria bacterium]QOJ32961.1 MAG: NAD(P)H-binding protein [Gammaproteobacteria bacterium]CAG0940403.1 NAD(P)H dehydrogenase (quinone) [Gammaproteobacteria bacterium]
MTAASGRLGHATLRALVREVGAASVVGVARRPARIAVPGIETRSGDYQSVRSMEAALEGIDALVMISAPVTPGTDRLALHRNAIAGATRAGVKTTLYTSVIGSDGAKGTLFKPMHGLNRQTEAELRASGMQWIVARNGLYMELDLEHIIRAGAQGGVYRNPGGPGRAPYITIDELAFGAARLVTGAAPAGRVYNLCGECATQAELVALANAVFGLAVAYDTESDEDCIARFLRVYPERGEDVARMLTGCFQCIRNGAFDVPSDFAAATGRPCRSLRQMMEDCRSKRATG